MRKKTENKLMSLFFQWFIASTVIGTMRKDYIYVSFIILDVFDPK